MHVEAAARELSFDNFGKFENELYKVSSIYEWHDYTAIHIILYCSIYSPW